jgi:5'-phosphate synthase pdxT subunit
LLFDTGSFLPVSDLGQLVSKDTVGILALQGDFEMHRQMFERIGASVSLVRTSDDLDCVDRLVIPGGESSTMFLLLERYNLMRPLLRFASDRPVWGTCAGLLLLATRIDDPQISPLGLIDISASRNAYGRQIESFVADGVLRLDKSERPYEMVFIRAPKIISISDSVDAIGWCGDEITMARQGRVLVTAFHPELTEDTTIHEYYLSM